MSNVICSTLFDSRDLIEEVEELKDDLKIKFNGFIEENYPDKFDELEVDDYVDIEDCPDEKILQEFNEYEELDITELKEIIEFIEELESYSEDFEYGVTIIHEDYWVEFVEEDVKSLGYINNDLPWWISNHIDWEGVADEVAQDYTEVDFQGSNYYVR